mgnify:CR=1 FL=1
MARENKLEKIGQNSFMDNFVKTDDTIIWTALVIAALSGCGSSDASGNTNVSESLDAAGSLDTSEAENTESDAEKEETVVYETPAVENGEISINADTLTSNPMYINYDSNGTNIQLIAVKGSDGTPRLSLNTCQVCNPSPRAYFKEQNGRLVCQNCGNVFTTDSVGETTGGCNPMYIDYKNTDGKLTVSVADLDTYADQFASWDGPVK